MLGESSVNIRAWAWASDPQSAFILECDLLESIKKRFDKDGIVIPFPQRTISYLENKE
jgi:small-conductance mechanosensitive channel